jgi:hypothetical protein
MAGYDPNQPRDDDGKWSEIPGHVQDKITSNENQVNINTLKGTGKYKIFLELASESDRVKASHPELSIEEKAAVYGYTRSQWETLNKHLRAKYSGEFVGRSEQVNYLNEYESLLNISLSKMKSVYSGEVYRGSMLSEKDLGGYVVGKTKIENGFFSTSSKPGAQFPGNTMFIINSKGGKELLGLSSRQEEREVLFPSRTSFTVKKKEKKGETTYIYLDEH